MVADCVSGESTNCRRSLIHICDITTRTNGVGLYLSVTPVVRQWVQASRRRSISYLSTVNIDFDASDELRNQINKDVLWLKVTVL
jgi:hypothetical protein